MDERKCRRSPWRFSGCHLLGQRRTCAVLSLFAECYSDFVNKPWVLRGIFILEERTMSNVKKIVLIAYLAVTVTLLVIAATTGVETGTI